MKKGKHIILGHCGFVGSCFMQFLQNQNKNVIGYDIKNGESEDCKK